jgi:GT2 family glycosyltransferase
MMAVTPSPPASGAASTRSPLVAIILVTYRGKDDTLACLASLEKMTYPNYRVFVVDQNSGDDTLETIAAQFPWAHRIANPVNNGFTGGNNLGMRAALEQGANYLFLLNNDTEVAPDLLEPLVTLAESDARIGAIGPKMLYHGEPETIWSAGGAIDWRGHAVMLDQGKRSPYQGDQESETPRDVDYVVGCGLMVKRSVAEQVGLLDDRYFIYYEETDWCARIRKAGYRVVHVPQACLWHKVSKTFGPGSEFTLYYMRRNLLLYLGERGERPLLGRLVALYDALRLAAVWTIQGKHRRRRVLLRAVGDYLRGRFGKSGLTFQQ